MHRVVCLDYAEVVVSSADESEDYFVIDVEYNNSCRTIVLVGVDVVL